MVCHESFRSGQHAFIGGSELPAEIPLGSCRPKNRVANEQDECLDSTFGDVSNGSIGGSSEREKLREGKTRVEEVKSGAHCIRIGFGVERNSRFVEMVRQEQTRSGD
jgi:hypothetical protein